MQSTWETRDLPILTVVAERLDPQPGSVLRMQDVVTATGLTEDEVKAGLVALLSGRYVEGKPLDTMGGLIDVFISAITERGRRTVGLWPSGESVDALVDALRQAAEQVDDEDDRSFLRKAAGMLGGVSRDVMTDVMAAVIRQQAGLG